MVVPFHLGQKLSFSDCGFHVFGTWKDVLGKDVYNYKFNTWNIKAAVGTGSLGSAFGLPAQS